MNSSLIHLRLLCKFCIIILITHLSVPLTVNSQVTISGGSTVNGVYPSISAAIIALNGAVISGPVVIDVNAGHSETSPSGGIEMTATGTMVNTITLKKFGAGINPKIIAYTGGTGTPTTVVQDGIFRLVGSDYVTIDGIDLEENSLNTTNPSTMEYGYSFFKASTSNGCHFNTIKNCTITLSHINNATSTLPATEGSRGIQVVNSTQIAQTTSLIPVSQAGANSNNKFHSNTIKLCNYGIVLSGYAAPSPFTLGDTLNDIGGSFFGTGNTILNFGGAPAATNPSAGIRAINQWGVNISYNTINNNDGTHTNHVTTFRGIYAQSGTSASANINFNHLDIKGGGTTSQLAIIENGIGATPAGNTVNIMNNVITGSYLTATSGAFYGIYNLSATAAVVNIVSNSISNTTYSSAGLTGTGVNYLIYNSANLSTMVLNIADNEIINHYRTGTSGGTTIGIYHVTGTTGMQVNVKRNTIEGLSIDGSGTTSTLYGIQTSTGTIRCDSNNVSYLTCFKTSGTSALYGIYNGSSPVDETYNYNEVNNLTHNGTGILYGIYAFTTTGIRTVRNNVIHSLRTGGTTISGIQMSSSVPTIFNNKIYNLESLSTGAPTVSGIMITSSTAGTIPIYNNLIGDLRAPNANTSIATAPSVRGINFTTTTSSTTLAVSYNTILLNAMSFGTNFGTAGIFHTTSTTATSAMLELNNNNIVNLSTPKGIGKTTAYQRSSATLTNFGTNSNRNNLYAGGVCNERLIFFDGTNSDSTLAQYQARVNPRDANSVSETPHFISTNGASANFLHIDQTKPTLLESGAAPIAGITNDFDGDTRNVTTPDIGGDEFLGSIPSACNGTPVSGTISSTPTSGCSGNKATLCVSGQSNTSGLSYQWKFSNNVGGPFDNIPCAKDKCYMTDTLSAGTYYFQLMVTCDASGLSSTTPTYTFVVNGSPTISVSPPAPSICSGSPVSLTASGAISYSWAPATGLNMTTGATVMANPIATTTYTVTGTDVNGCTGTQSVTVSVNPSPQISSVTAVPNPICIGGSTQLDLMDADTAYYILPIVYGVIDSTGWNAVNLVTAGIANIGLSAGTLDDGYWSGISIPFSFNLYGTLYNTAAVGTNGNLQLGTLATGGYNGVWPTATAPNGVIGGVHADLRMDNAATNVYYFTRGVSPNRQFILVVDNAGFFSGGGNASYQIVLNEFDYTVEIHTGLLTNTTTNKVQGIENGPGTVAAVVAGRNNTPTWSGIPDAYRFSRVKSYSWSPPTYLNNTTIKNPLGTGILNDISYTVTVTAPNGCTDTEDIDIIVNPKPTISCNETSGNLPNDCVICSGANASLTASGGVNYLWSNGGMTASIVVSPAMTTIYTVTVTDADNCTGTQSITVMVNANPNPSISPSNPQICPGESVQLNGSGGGSYLWSTGSTAPFILVSPITSTTYFLTVTNANGCSAIASATVNVKAGVTLDHSRIEPSTCQSQDGSIDLMVTAGQPPFSYNWFTPNGSGLVNGQEDQNGLSIGSYFVTVTSTNGCSATRQINLVGPGNCSVCPTIGGLSKSVNSICRSAPFTLTATGLVNMGTTYGITFKYSTTMLTGTEPYTMGSVIGTVPNGGLTMGGTQAVLNTASIPISGPVFLYAILSPTPTDPACRPSAANSVNVVSCNVIISDPCACLNNATTLTNGQFSETIKVTAPPGQIWRLTANTGLYTTSSPPPPGAPVLIPINTILTEMPINSDSSMYILAGRHVDAMGYNVTVSNTVTSSSISNTCYYPNPTINNLNARYCVTDPAFTLQGSAQLGDGSGPAMGVGTFRINGNIATIFNPGALGIGTHTVQYCFDAADGIPNGQHPGCNQCISQSVGIDGPPTITCPANLNVSCAIDVPAPNPALVTINSNPCPNPAMVVHVSDVISNQTCRDRFTLTRTYRATNPCCPNNPVTCTQIITVNDVTPPSPFCPANQNLQCASQIPPVNTASVITADGCGNAGIVVTHVSDTRVNETCPNRFTLNRVYRATDICGNSATCLQVFTVFDNVAPSLTCRNLTIYVDQNGNATLIPSAAVVNVSDNCTPAAQITLGASTTNFTCANLGPNQVTIFATDECANVGICTTTVTVLDTIAPVIMGCPIKSPVTLNLGPGACEISWDVPPFMAMDNCLVPSRLFGARNTTTVCLPPASYWSITGGANSWGVMFDLVNTSGMALNLQLLGERAFANVPHRIWYRTAPGGHAPVQGTPAAWTLCATRTPQFGAQFTTIIDSFNLITGVVRDTMVSCTGTRIDSSSVGCLTMLPGETRGIYIHAPGTPGTNASLFNGCTPAQMGNAQITTPLNGATYTGGEFAAPFINSSFGFGGANWIGVIGYNLGASTNLVPLVQTCGAPYGPGCFFPIGCVRLCYEARDAAGNVGRCEFEVCVNEYSNPINELACNDLIQISLDDSCRATIHPDMLLEGGPYACYDNYIVTARDWITNAIIDRDPNRPGVQIDRRDIGRDLRITVTDPRTGNSCWGKATVEDKLAPKISCSLTSTLLCGEDTSPNGSSGLPSIEENCGSYSLTYRDRRIPGGCDLGFSEIIERTWYVEDQYGNRGECIQQITVALGDLASVTVPPNYDNIDQPILNCDEKIDRNKNIVPHMLDNPVCLDGYILDSAYWLARPTQLDQYPNRRIPRVLGWNCIDDPADVHFGHPSPDPVYYPQHRLWQPNNPLCWGPDTHIMWIGTGRPGGSTSCHNLAVTYKDIVFDLATPDVMPDPLAVTKCCVSGPSWIGVPVWWAATAKLSRWATWLDLRSCILIPSESIWTAMSVQDAGKSLQHGC
ncbi:MAG: hypothetical protein IPM48_12485 [Saprospiraceae bacterium]|nr:hypothetical protein [Saprospiraceae bacterium]